MWLEKADRVTRIASVSSSVCSMRTFCFISNTKFCQNFPTFRLYQPPARLSQCGKCSGTSLFRRFVRPRRRKLRDASLRVFRVFHWTASRENEPCLWGGKEKDRSADRSRGILSFRLLLDVFSFFSALAADVDTIQSWVLSVSNLPFPTFAFFSGIGDVKEHLYLQHFTT